MQLNAVVWNEVSMRDVEIQTKRQMTEIHTERDRQADRDREIRAERKKSRNMTVTEIAHRQTEATDS